MINQCYGELFFAYAVWSFDLHQSSTYSTLLFLFSGFLTLHYITSTVLTSFNALVTETDEIWSAIVWVVLGNPVT